MRADDTSLAPPVLLLVDDEPSVRAVLTRFADRHGFETIACATGREALEILETRRLDVALVDVRLPDVGGLEVLKAIRGSAAECQVILMTGATDVESSVEAIRLGAMAYLSKPINFDRLSQLFSQACEIASARAGAGPEAEAPAFHGLIGDSAAMARVFTSIRRLAPYARVALVTGDTGTGKELVARALHAAGPRARQRLVTINCSAVVETLFESELFGHAKGAFTGASADKAGLFEQAHRGTLFLDEIGELPLAMQAKLLRVLESGELLRVGAVQPRIVDVHIIAATNRDLRAEVAAGRFRQDPLFRINMIEIPLPALRARPDDIPVLARTFLARSSTRMRKHFTGFTPHADAALKGAPWPGNVRELRNVVERACMVADGERIGVVDLALEALTPERRRAMPGLLLPAIAMVARPTLAVVERDQLLQALGRSSGNKAEAAEALGISRRAFYRRLERHGLDRVIHRRAAMPGIVTELVLAGAA